MVSIRLKYNKNIFRCDRRCHSGSCIIKKVLHQTVVQHSLYNKVKIIIPLSKMSLQRTWYNKINLVRGIKRWYCGCVTMLKRIYSAVTDGVTARVVKYVKKVTPLYQMVVKRLCNNIEKYFPLGTMWLQRLL